jgi:lipoyl(octanoyl) transferase
LAFAEGDTLVWRILDTPPAPGGWNMAVDEALALRRRPGEAVLRFYGWSRPTLSFGRHQRALTRYDPLALKALGVDAVRRPTGGREVLHDRELTYSVVVPARWGGDGVRAPRALYRAVNEVLVRGLRTLGVPASLAGRDRPPLSPDAGACFGAPAPDELEVLGGKLVGSAQRRYGESLLQHGSILLAPSLTSLAALEAPSTTVAPSPATPSPAPPSPAPPASTALSPPPEVTLLGVLGRPVPVRELMRVLEPQFAGAFGGRWGRGVLRADEHALAETLLPHFRNPLGPAL